MPKAKLVTIFLSISLLLSGCSYNPFIANHDTGTPGGFLAGAAAGMGGIALLGSTKILLTLAGLGGGAAGYYATTLRYQAGGIYQAGGSVYSIGNVANIYIPTDQIFEPNTADFLPQAGPVLASLVTVLKRFPQDKILISGNTSGFARQGYEVALSKWRARRIAAYLWEHRIGRGVCPGPTRCTTHQMMFVGQGNFYPVAADYTNNGIRQNSRVQIVAYPGSMCGPISKIEDDFYKSYSSEKPKCLKGSVNLKGEG